MEILSSDHLCGHWCWWGVAGSTVQQLQQAYRSTSHVLPAEEKGGQGVLEVSPCVHTCTSGTTVYLHTQYSTVVCTVCVHALCERVLCACTVHMVCTHVTACVQAFRIHCMFDSSKSGCYICSYTCTCKCFTVTLYTLHLLPTRVLEAVLVITATTLLVFICGAALSTCVSHSPVSVGSAQSLQGHMCVQLNIQQC